MQDQHGATAQLKPSAVTAVERVRVVDGEPDPSQPSPDLDLVRTCAFMMRSMLADQPCLEVTTTTGVLARRFETLTPMTSAPSCSFHHLVRSLNSSCTP